MSLSSLFCQQKKNNRHLASQENKLSHFIQVIRKNLTQRKLSGILANTNSVELSSFQGIGFQIYLIVFTSLVMSNLLVFVSFFDILKKKVMYLSLIPSFKTFIQLLSVSFPSPPTSSLWVKDNRYLLFYLFKRNAVCSSHFSPMSNQIV